MARFALRKPRASTALFFLAGGFVALSSTLFYGWVIYSPDHARPFTRETSSLRPNLFSSHYPRGLASTQELEMLKKQGQLTPHNELLITQTVEMVSGSLAMPSSLLWCLLFQESRLNPLAGLEENRISQGLGQFSHFSYDEINHDLEKYGPANLRMMREVMGQDVRPIEPLRGAIDSPSSYFSIPTAVVASASYLNNRYMQLESEFKRHGYPADPDLIWLSAAMAYNKGSRSVLTILNEVQKYSGRDGVHQLMTDPDVFFRTTTNHRFLTRSFETIWGTKQARAYGRELAVHVARLRDCATEPVERQNASEPARETLTE
jgi:hypothetical protein